MYKRDDGTKEVAADGLDEKQLENRALNAREIMDSWHLLPGLEEGGFLNEDELSAWIDAARKSCGESGHVKGGDLQIGLLLSRAPSDKDGAWPHVAVRNVIERLKNNVIEKHIPFGIYNSRGVVTRNLTEGGGQERSLAESYKKMIEITKTKWPRTTAILRAMADWYDSDAKREDVTAELNDLRFG